MSWQPREWNNCPIPGYNSPSAIAHPINTSITVDPFLEELAGTIQQLQSFQSLDFSDDRRTLATKALNALKNRENEDIIALANRLAEDVAVIID